MTDTDTPAVVWLVRHDPLDLPFGTCVGFTDIPVADPGALTGHAKALARLIGPAGTVFTSDLARCFVLAQPLAAVLNAPLRSTPGLRELNFGRWEMKTWTDIEREDPDGYARFMADWKTTPAPGGESYEDLRRRVAAVWEEAGSSGERTVVFVGHGGSLRMLAGRILGLPDEEAMMIPLERGRCARIDVGRREPIWNIDPAAPPPDLPPFETSETKRVRKGLLMVNTGDGKGKTTAALGTAFRALGRGWTVAVVQFIKGAWATGESRLARTLPGIAFLTMGRGFTWESENLEQDKAAAREAWDRAAALIEAGDHPLVILDEITYPINFGFLSLDDVMTVLRRRPPHVHVIVTGRDAPAALIDAADVVTDMREVKHPYQQGIEAQPGIDF